MLVGDRCKSSQCLRSTIRPVALVATKYLEVAHHLLGYISVINTELNIADEQVPLMAKTLGRANKHSCSSFRTLNLSLLPMI